MNSDKWEEEAAAQKLCCGFAAASSRYARRDLRCAFTEPLRGVDLCLILDQFGELITCPIQEGDGALWLIEGPSFIGLHLVQKSRAPRAHWTGLQREGGEKKDEG